MTDRMDQIIEAAEQQGFEVNQTKPGTWVFRTGGLTVTHRDPQTVQDWLSLIRRLEAAGLVLPE
jgi:hypothetical protein